MTTERKTLKIPSSVYRRLKAQRRYPEEPFARILERLLRSKEKHKKIKPIVETSA